MTRISVQLPYAEKESFMKIAVKNDMSMSQLLRWFIRSVNENSGGFAIEIKKVKGASAMSSIGIRLPADEKEQLAAYAKANDMTVSQVVRSLIRTMRFSVSSRSDEIENQKADAKRRQTPIDRSYENERK